MRNLAVLVGIVGVLAGVGGAVFALTGASVVATALGLAAVVCFGAVTVLAYRLVAARTRAISQALQRDRRALVQEVRNVTTASKSLHQASSRSFKEAIKDSNAGLTRTIKEQVKLKAPAALGNTAGTVATLGGVGPKFEYAQRMLKAPGGLETFALRTRSTEFRDVFARAATGMQYDYSDVLRILRTYRGGKLSGGSSTIRHWHFKHLLGLARTVANQRSQPGDIADAEVIFNAVHGIFGANKFGRTDAYVFAEVLGALGQHRRAARVLRETRVARRDPVHARMVDANAVASREPFEGEQWLPAINRLFEGAELAQISFDENSSRSPLDSLRTDIAPRTEIGPLVTVIVPTFNGSDFIQTTLDCLVAQTWKNIEIIVVDDASDPGHAERLVQICNQYPEVTLLVQDTNQGAYPARNRAVAEARGEYITVHDDDDWSHAQKIELQVRHLIDNPDVKANMTRHARSSEGLVFSRINNNPSFSQPNFSSLMLSRDLILELGGWDNVNRGADAEFRDRLVNASGTPVEVLLDVPLSFTRTHAASLTAGEIGRGYIDPSRLFYQAAYQKAHREALDGDQAWSDLTFARPVSMQPGKRNVHLGRFDVVFATDFSFPGGTTHLTLNEIEAAVEAGLRVGVVNLMSPVNNGLATPNERALATVMQPGVELLSLSDDADVDTLLIRHASVLQYAERLSSKLAVKRVIVVVNNPPVLDGGKGYLFDFATVSDNARRLFGVEATIMAESGVTRDLARRVARPHELSDSIWPGFVDLARFTPKSVRQHDKPVLGRHSRDAVLKWPDRLSTIQQVYLSNEIYDVRILGGVGSLPQGAAESLHAGAEVLEFGAVPPEDFLADLDFWAYFHSDALTESFGMATVEAMASGLVVILPKYMEENFGDGAIYGSTREVRGLVEKYWNDPDLYAHQAAKARRVAEELFSESAFLARLRGLDARPGVRE